MKQQGMPWAPPEPDPKVVALAASSSLSADRRRTMRQKAALAAGVHPLAGGKVQTAPERTCGACAHAQRHKQTRVYWKCGLRGGGSPATDIRLSWPGCRSWKARSGPEPPPQRLPTPSSPYEQETGESP